MKNIRKHTAISTLLHFVVVLVHATAHTVLAINMLVWQNAYIVSVILLLPLIAGFLIITKKYKIGLLILLFSMLGAFLFGGSYHYLVSGPDNISYPREFSYWLVAFQASAILLTVTELYGIIVGFLGLSKIKKLKKS
ncbi:hypothetical protein ACSVDA_14335 [Cytobacillus sp. Hm23]